MFLTGLFLYIQIVVGVPEPHALFDGWFPPKPLKTPPVPMLSAPDNAPQTVLKDRIAAK